MNAYAGLDINPPTAQSATAPGRPRLSRRGKASSRFHMRVRPDQHQWIRDHGGTAYVLALVRADRKRRLAAERKARQKALS